MRTLSIQAARALVLTVFLFLAPTKAGQVSLRWDESPDAITYTIYYGLQNFTLPEVTNASLVSIPFIGSPSAVVSNLAPGLTYYFAVVAVDAQNAESDYSNVATLTIPPTLPDLPPGASTSGTNSGSTSGGSGTTGGSGTPSSATQVSLIGMLPRLWLYPTNGQALLALQGTVGATFAIQSSTNPAVADSWTTITNIKLAAIAPEANTTPGTTLEKAFIPALESFQDPNPTDGALRYYRIYMPLGYAVLADQVLTAQGFDTRLIAVRCPGLSGYIVCYVTEEAAYLDYNSTTYIVKLETSGATIREVANKVATTLQQNWTSASEFTVADDGTKHLFATVVQTDNPLTDPPLGIPRTSAGGILIDF